MKVSIITAVLNNRESIRDNLESVAGQTYPDVEHLIIDGGSTDGTVEVLRACGAGGLRWSSEPDRGIYDALNKGLRRATGEVIGILHGDDVYAHRHVLEEVADVFRTRQVDSCYGDLQYVDKGNIDKVVRLWKSSPFKAGKFRYGWMPPHPTFFAKREIYERFNGYNPEFRIAGDYELMLRFLEIHKISTHYIPEVLVKMRVGGVSNRSLGDMLVKTREDYRAWKVNRRSVPLCTILLKHLVKIPQFLRT
jgi:glycosyltransferase involved in cell wall biosynthesis